jgi:hypothetical protein
MICHVEGSETSQIVCFGTEHLKEAEDQRFFSRACGIKMTT